MWSRRPSIGIVPLVLTLAACAALGEDEETPRHPDDPQFRQIIAALKEWEGRLTSARVRWRGAQVSGEGTFANSKRAESRHVWAISPLDEEKLHSSWIIDGKLWSQRADFAYPDRSVSLQYPDRESLYEEPKEITIEPWTGNAWHGIEPLATFRNPPVQIAGRAAAREWLSDVIVHFDVTILEPEAIDGVECPRWSLKDPRFKKAQGLTLTFDPSHGNLTRRIYGTTVIEYREVSPGFWFPWVLESSFRHGDDASTTRYEVEELTLGTDVAPSEFVFPAPKGTPVRDEILKRNYRYGIDDPSEPHRPPVPKNPNDLLFTRLRWGALILVALAVLAVAIRRLRPPL